MARIYHTWQGFYPSGFENTASFAQDPAWRIDNIINFGSIGYGDSWCLSYWFKFPSSFPSGVYSVIHSSGPGAGSFLMLHSTPLIFTHNAYDGASLKRNQLWTNGTVGAVRDDNWHHIAITANSYTWNVNDLAMYVDGVNVGVVLRAEQTAATPAWTPAAFGFILSASNPGGYLFDEFSFFDYIPPIADLFNGGVPGDLNALPTPPLNWARGENNLLDSGSLGQAFTTATSPVYSTDVP